MPLCWAHAEYLNLVRSRADGRPFDRIQPAYDRYVRRRPVATHEIWTPAHQITQMPSGKVLRVIVPPEVTAVRWRWAASQGGPDGNAGGHSAQDKGGEVPVTITALGCAFADLPTDEGGAKGWKILFEMINAKEAILGGKVKIHS
ncbi:MAG: hypothetical protein EOP86_24785 [Verrucomicrobiaceae bacterium]|nr:MAG: hypothetical protein EOP86_24785 [Verrucomicrobiaceae bacterium]